MTPFVFAVVHFITLHGPTNGIIYLQTMDIVGLRTPRTPHEGHFHKDVSCLVFTSDGKFSSVVETCDEVLKKIVEAEGGLGDQGDDEQ